MSLKFPHLKSTTEPLGLVEQLGVSLTMKPEEDPSVIPANSWFGRLLLPDGFKWTYLVKGKVIGEISDRNKIAEAYLSEALRYTAYNMTHTFLNIEGDGGEIRGQVEIKGRCALTPEAPNHTGKHAYRYTIRRGSDGKWKLQTWTLDRLDDGERPPLSQII